MTYLAQIIYNTRNLPAEQISDALPGLARRVQHLEKLLNQITGDAWEEETQDIRHTGRWPT